MLKCYLCYSILMRSNNADSKQIDNRPELYGEKFEVWSAGEAIKPLYKVECFSVSGYLHETQGRLPTPDEVRDSMSPELRKAYDSACNGVEN